MRTILFMAFLCILGCRQSTEVPSNEGAGYEITNRELYDEIAAMDKKYFDAYNTCDLETQAALIADDIEFYHDQGGLSKDKSALILSIKANICGKVTRELVPGSLEVYPIPDYGAVSMGYHRFHNSEEPDQESLPSRFITIWRNDAEKWQMARVVSLHR